MLAALTRWVRYQRALNRLENEILSEGYSISPWKQGQLEARARVLAGYPASPS